MAKSVKTIPKKKSKHITIEDLQKAGIPIVKGKDFGLSKFIKGPVPSLKEVRKILSKIKMSLSEEVIKMREEE